MLFTKLEIYGTVHNRPDEHVSHIHSKPLGMTKEEVQERIVSFEKAFKLEKYRISA